MPSGKKSKQARRAAAAPPPVVSKGSGGARRRQANPRVLAIAGGVVALVVLAVVLAIVFTGGGKSSAATNFPAVGSLSNDYTLPGSSDIADELKGIPQKGMSLGNPKAPVTLLEYVDLQCPICREFESTVMPDVIAKYVRKGKVRVETRVLQFIGPDSLKARNAMIAAAKQNKAYNFALVLYANQGTENTGWVTDDMLGQIASSVPGLRVHELFSEMGTSAVKSQGEVFDRQGAADKVPGTPTVYVGKTGTKGDVVALTAGNDYQAVATALDNALG
ncbi:MAG TPA: thioredoxin domain-containing protein [Gaiellaceae bacterium]|nr:thioredoxin domain-containing protein [Gaiellaceae bacterium]